MTRRNSILSQICTFVTLLVMPFIRSLWCGIKITIAALQSVIIWKNFFKFSKGSPGTHTALKECAFSSNIENVTLLKPAIIARTRRNGGVFPFDAIPTAKRLPAVGTLFDLIAAGGAPKLHKYIDKRHQQLGPIFRERLPGGAEDVVFVSSANLMRSVFLYEGQHPRHPLPDAWILYNQQHNCHRGLFFMNGSEWLTNRRVLNRFLLNGNLSWMNSHIDICTERMMADWRQKAVRAGGFVQIENLERQLYRWATDVVCSVMFGSVSDMSSSANLQIAFDQFSENVHKIFESSAPLMTFPANIAKALHLKRWTNFEKDVTDVLRMGYEIVDMRVKLSNAKDVGITEGSSGLLARLQESGMQIDVIKRIFVDLIIAAGDTTAFSSQWALYLLALDKSLQERIRNEYSQDQKEMSIVRGLIKETLRLYPVAPFIGRYLATDAVIGNYKIKKDTLLLLSLYTSGRDPAHFPNPLEVNPERWNRDEETGQLQDVFEAHGSLPFAIGSRSCIGRKLANSQMHALIIAISRNFYVKCNNKDPVDCVLRLIAVPGKPLELGIKLIEDNI